ncbi:MAG: non-ribosomal peptide synthetase [Alphaproteobacteria bacterium]|nr:non-ribosomal peptide synthetase [Alphaproteobacteria bacterium]
MCDVIRRWADIQPGAPALIAQGKAPCTYGALVALMDGIRGTLNASGFGRGDRIAVIHGGGADMMAVMVGVMSGATAVPLSPNATEAELEAQLALCGVAAVIADATLDGPVRALARRRGLPCFELETRDPSVTGDLVIEPIPGRAPKPDEEARFEDIGLVLTTSGSTAEAKVAPMGWRANMARLHNNTTQFRLGPDDCCFVMRPLYYRGAYGNCVDTLYSGGRAVVVPRFGADELLEALVPHGVTWFACGPTFLHALHQRLDAHRDEIAGAKLRFIRAGTSPLDPGFAEALETALGVPILESYSTTETGRLACNPLPPARRKRGTVGTLHGDEVAILGPDGAVLPQGSYGEIVTRGDQTFAGYENAEEINAEAFAGGWFHTGDEGYFDDDGYLVLTGRIKEMINRGGEKVSPAEVDAALLAHPDVAEAAVFPISHQTLGEEVAAAVVRTPGAAIDEKALTAHLLKILAGHKVPRRIVFVDRIPRGETGKIQRYRLADMLGLADAAPAASGPDTRAPSPLEAELQAIWAEALGRDRVALDDNFFLLGGDSLQAVELFLEIERRLGRRLPVAALFEAGTVAEMARLIEAEAPQGCMVALQPKGSRPPFFCVHGNGGEVIGFYNLARHLGPDQPFYGIQAVGWDGSVVPFTRTRDMAAHYVAEMRKVQPKGPYLLGGYSFGGRIAVHMAAMLRQAGEEVALLALLDSNSHVGRTWVTLDQWIARHGAPTGPARWAETLRYVWFRTRKACDAVNGQLRRALLVGLWETYRATGWTLPQGLRRPDRANRIMRMSHRRMPAYDGDAVYFKTAPAPGSPSHPDAQGTWDRVIRGRLQVVDVPGGHDDIIREPYAAVLAEKLAAALSKASPGTRA